MLNRMWTCAAVLGLLAGVAQAQEEQQRREQRDQNRTERRDQDKTPDFSNLSDNEFAAKAATCGSFEVKAGELAQTKATNPDVKQFAQHLVTDHTKANQELKQIISTKQGIIIPQTLDEKQQECWNKLTKSDGAEFDRTFMQEQVKAHREAVALFEHESKNGKDEQFKAFATKALPKLREHLQHAEQVWTKVKGTDR